MKRSVQGFAAFAAVLSLAVPSLAQEPPAEVPVVGDVIDVRVVNVGKSSPPPVWTRGADEGARFDQELGKVTAPGCSRAA